MQRVAVLEQLEPLMRTQVREVQHVPTTRVAFEDKGAVIYPGGGAHAVEFSVEGLKSLFSFIGVPEKLPEKLRTGTVATVTNELLGQRERYTLVLKDGKVVTFTKPGQFHTLNPERALTAIEKAMPGADYSRVLFPDPTSVSLEVVGEQRLPVVRGDLVRAGANVSFSPIGTIDPKVMSYVSRLACTNGAISNTILREYHYRNSGGDPGGNAGDGQSIWDWLRKSVKEAYGALEGIVERYREMEKEKLNPADRAALLEAMLKEARIGGEDAEAVRALAIANPPNTTWDLYNLITNATSHILEGDGHIRRAQLEAADIADDRTHQRICPVCRRQN